MIERRDGDRQRAPRGVRRDVAAAAAVLARRLRGRLGRRRRRDAHRRPRPARPRPVARAARRASPSPYAVLGDAAAMTSATCAGRSAYLVVAWSALLGIQWRRPRHRRLAALLHPLPAAVGDAAARWAAVGTVVAVVAFSLVRWAQTRLLGRRPHRRSVVSAPSRWRLSLVARAVHQPDHRRGRAAAPRRSTSCAPPRPGSPRRSATAGCTRSASGSRARSTTPWPRASPRWCAGPAPPRPRWPAVTSPRPASGSRSSSARRRDNLAEARLIVAELTPGHLQSRTLGEALERLGAAVPSETGMHADVRVAGEPGAARRRPPRWSSCAPPRRRWPTCAGTPRRPGSTVDPGYDDARRGAC